MYLIIRKDYTLAKSETLSGEIRTLARKGEISVVDCRKMVGMNSSQWQSDLGEWSEINDFYASVTPPDETNRRNIT